jgi:hypothetical protein
MFCSATMPPALGWIQYLSLFRYAYEALVVNDLTDVQVIDTVSGATVNVSYILMLSLHKQFWISSITITFTNICL